MKVVFVSNFLNHHQLPLCEALVRLTGDQFIFVATTPVPQERLDFGYHDMNAAYPFVLRTYENEQSKRSATEAIDKADMVIAGSAPEEYLRHRLNQGKLIFRYSERLYKQGYIYLFARKRRKYIREAHLAYQDKPVYMLCASSFTSGDFSLNGAYRSKCFKWGYFPEVKQHNLEELMSRKHLSSGRISILWAGRLIRWKHPEASILAVEKLMKAGYDFQLTIIGSGEMETELRDLITAKGLDERVELKGSLPPEEVRLQMEKSAIFLFTSDYQEGWGAVLNESMNSGCAVIASNAAGSTGFLIQDGKNGRVYESGNVNELYLKIKELLDDRDKIVQMGKAAYYTMESLWNPEVAAERLLELSESLLCGRTTPFKDGPCSVAEKKIGGRFYSRK